MAGEAETGKETVAQTETLPPDELKGPEDEGSLSNIMENIQRPTFTGHPAMGGGEEESSQEEGEESPEKTGEDEVKPPGSPEPPEFKPKYKSHEEAEKGIQEAERRMHEATTQAAQEKEARERAERETEELRQKLAEKEAAKPPEPPPVEPPKPVTKEERKGRIKSALATIRSLDETDPDYDEKVADAWAEAGVGGMDAPFPDKDEIGKIIAQQVDEKLKAEKEAQRQRDEEDRRQQETADIRSQANDLAAKSGLNMEKGTADYRLFWDMARELPEEVKGKTFNDQVKWTVNEVRRLKGEVVQTTDQARQRARETQKSNAVLERGGARPKTPEKPEPFSLGSIMEGHQAARRI